MNPWELVLNVLGWITLVVVIAFVVAVIQRLISDAVQKRAQGKRARAISRHPSSGVPSDSSVAQAAVLESKRLYASDLFLGVSRATAFEDGVRFALAAKRGTSHE